MLTLRQANQRAFVRYADFFENDVRNQRGRTRPIIEGQHRHHPSAQIGEHLILRGPEVGRQAPDRVGNRFP
jgi:hypothetical protein